MKKKYSIYYDLDDDVSEIMIKVFMNLSSFDVEKSKFRSWVFSIAKNHMIDKWRNNTITLTGNSCITIDVTNNGGNYVTSTDTSVIDFNTNTTTNCCASSMELENSSSISYVSDQLTPQDFTLLDMKYVQGYTYNEIGCEFNLTSSTISNKVNYIKTKLKKNNPEIIYE